MMVLYKDYSIHIPKPTAKEYHSEESRNSQFDFSSYNNAPKQIVIKSVELEIHSSL
jgi:hypothetical protein